MMRYWIVLAMMLLCGTAYAATADVWWTPNTEADIKGYRVYLCSTNPCAKSSASVKSDVLHPKSSTSFEVGTSGNVAVTAYDQVGNESEFSATLPFAVGGPDIAPAPPINPRVFVH